MTIQSKQLVFQNQKWTGKILRCKDNNCALRGFTCKAVKYDDGNFLCWQCSEECIPMDVEPIEELLWIENGELLDNTIPTDLQLIEEAKCLPVSERIPFLFKMYEEREQELRETRSETVERKQYLMGIRPETSEKGCSYYGSECLTDYESDSNSEETTALLIKKNQ